MTRLRSWPSNLVTTFGVIKLFAYHNPFIHNDLSYSQELSRRSKCTNMSTSIPALGIIEFTNFVGPPLLLITVYSLTSVSNSKEEFIRNSTLTSYDLCGHVLRHNPRPAVHEVI